MDTRHDDNHTIDAGGNRSDLLEATDPGTTTAPYTTDAEGGADRPLTTNSTTDQQGTPGRIVAGHKQEGDDIS
eukprot:14160687-Heterocapsa_arctica.AAC.1